MTNMLIYYDQLPPIDALLRIDLSYGSVAQILPEYKPVQADFICIYDMPELEVDDYLLQVQEKADKYALKLASLGSEVVWDLVLKPILLFKNKDCTFLFESFLFSLCPDEQFDFIYSLQSDYNQPWTHIQMIDHAHLSNIINHYEKRMQRV